MPVPYQFYNIGNDKRLFMKPNNSKKELHKNRLASFKELIRYTSIKKNKLVIKRMTIF